MPQGPDTHLDAPSTLISFTNLERVSFMYADLLMFFVLGTWARTCTMFNQISPSIYRIISELDWIGSVWNRAFCEFYIKQIILYWVKVLEICLSFIIWSICPSSVIPEFITCGCFKCIPCRCLSFSLPHMPDVFGWDQFVNLSLSITHFIPSRILSWVQVAFYRPIVSWPMSSSDDDSNDYKWDTYFWLHNSVHLSGRSG